MEQQNLTWEFGVRQNPPNVPRQPLRVSCAGGWTPWLGTSLPAFDILDLDAVSCLDTPSSRLDSLKKTGIILQLVIKPVVLGLEADENAGRPAMSSDEHLFILL